MTPEHTENLGFREWTTHYEKEQEADRDKINSLADTVGNLNSIVHRMSASVESIIENQKGLFNRVNRPWQWGVVMAGFMAMFSMAAMFGTMATLIVGPIKDSLAHLERNHALDVERNLELHMWFRETIADMQVGDAKAETHLHWLRKMERRANKQYPVQLLDDDGEN